MPHTRPWPREARLQPLTSRTLRQRVCAPQLRLWLFVTAATGNRCRWRGRRGLGTGRAPGPPGCWCSPTHRGGGALASQVNPVILFPLPDFWTQGAPSPQVVLTPQEHSPWSSLPRSFRWGSQLLLRVGLTLALPAGPVGNQLPPALPRAGGPWGGELPSH